MNIPSEAVGLGEAGDEAGGKHPDAYWSLCSGLAPGGGEVGPALLCPGGEVTLEKSWILSSRLNKPLRKCLTSLEGIRQKVGFEQDGSRSGGEGECEDFCR